MNPVLVKTFIDLALSLSINYLLESPNAQSLMAKLRAEGNRKMTPEELADLTADYHAVAAISDAALDNAPEV